MNKQSIIAILEEAKLAGVILWVEENQLKFKASKGNMSSDLLAKLKENKIELISLLTEVSSNNSISSLPLVKIPRDKKIPASSAQQRLWFVNNLIENENALYNITVIIKISGRINLNKIKSAIYSVINKHEALRTHFSDENGELFQNIISNQLPDINLYELNSSKSTEREQIINEQARTAFNLEKWPLFKLSLLKLSEQEIELVITLHHSIADGPSINIIYSDFISFYNDIGNQSKNSELFQYVDFTLWHNAQLENIREKQLSYWQEALSGELPVLEFFYDQPRKANQTFVGENFNFPLDIQNEFLSDMRKRNPQITMFNFFLAIYAMFLYRYTMQSTIIIGIPVSQRKHKELENTVGMFVNSMPIKLELNSNTTFNELLQQVSKKVVDAQLNADLPLEDIINAILPERSASHSPLFQTMFLLEEDTASVVQEDVAFSLQGIEGKVAKFDLTLAVKIKEGKNFSATFEYNTDLLSQETMQRVSCHFSRLCEQIIKNPDKRINEHRILNQSEENYLVHEINKTEQFFDDAIKLHQLFEKQAELNPDAIAVVCDNKMISYKNLNEQANQLARYLSSQGVNSQDTVAVLLPRSAEVVVTLLAILKIGAVFIPLDLDYPEKRIYYTLTDAKAKALITQSNYLNKIENFNGVIHCTDRDFIQLNKFNNDNLIHHSSMDDLAYIIYTSGSTGNPKGVMIHHLGISHYIQWAIKYYQVASGAGAPVHSSLAFDLTITSIFAPLSCGKTVFMIPDELGLQGLIDALNERQDYSLIKITPAHLKLLQTALDLETIKKLHACVVIGGEALYEHHVAHWLHHGEKMRFINEYGATETSVADTIYELPRLLPKSGSVPVGKAIDNSQMYVLDENLNPLPIGVVGEIYLSGVGLAKGYLNLPGKTAEKFLPHPFSKDPEEKIYKTGDTGKVLPDGNVVFVGRIDHQIKVKGYRVELGEIEATLKDCPSVKQSAVRVWKNDADENYITAYIVPHTIDIEMNHIRDFIKQHLPTYMIPSAFVKLSEIPLTVNGKVDTSALLQPKPEHFIIQNQFCAPRNEKEVLICQLWSELLGVENVSLYDNFFALGGDSILSIQFISRLREYGWQMTPRQLFSSQTVIEIAKIIEKSNIEIIAEEGLLTGACPLLPAQKWFLDQNFEEPNHFNQAFILVSKTKIDNLLLLKSTYQLVEHHDALRFVLSHEGQFYKKELPEEFVHFIKLPSDTLNNQMVWLKNQCNYYHKQLDLSAGNNIKFICFSNAEDNQDRLAIIAHHWIVDGVSWRIILEDLNALYEGRPLMRKTSSCRNWLEVINKKFKYHESQNDYQHWNNLALKDAYRFPDTKRLPYSEYYHAEWRLSEENTKMLLNQPAGFSGTSKISADLLYALGAALRDVISDNGFIVEMEGHGRENFSDNIDISRTIGWFTSQYPFHLNVQNEELEIGLAKVLAGLNTIPKKGLSYAFLASDMNALEDKSIAIIKPKIGFNYLGQFSHGDEKAFFNLSDTDAGSEISNQNHGWHVITISAWILNQCLHIDVKGHPDILSENLFNQFIDHMKKSLNAIIQYVNLEARKLIDIVEATPTQRLMWKSSKVQRDAYVTKMSWEIECDDIKLYQKAWNNLMSEYPILNSCFIEIENKLYQSIFNKSTVKWLSNEKDLPISFSDNIQYFYLEQCGLKTYRITWIYHHALLDGWSIPLIFNRLEIIYNALLNNNYHFQTKNQYLSGYHQWRNNRDENNAENFWNNTLSETMYKNTQTVTKLNVPHWKVICSTIPVDLMKHLESWSAESGITLATIIQYVWAHALAKFKKTNKVCFAVLASGRYSEIDHVTEIIGMLLEMIPVCWTFSNKSMSEEIINFNKHVEKAKEYGFYDWQSRGAIDFDSLFVYENYQNSNQVMQFEISSHTHVPLTFVGLPGSDNLTLALEYDNNHYREECMNELMKNTILEIKNFIENVNSTSKDSDIQQFIISHNNDDNKSPLFLIHPGSAGAEAYAEFVKVFSKNQPLCLIDSYNLNTMGDHLNSIQAMANFYLKVIKLKQPKGPYLLGGWSLGGLIGYEIARQLLLEGEVVNHLLLIDSLLVPDNFADVEVEHCLNQLMQIKLAQEPFQLLDQETIKKYQEVAVIESRAIANYKAKIKLPIMTTLYKAKSIRRLSNVENKELNQFLQIIFTLDDNGWSNGLDGVRIVDVDADHYSIVKESSAQKIADDIEQYIV